jgi:hypothetical protein
MRVRIASFTVFLSLIVVALFLIGCSSSMATHTTVTGNWMASSTSSASTAEVLNMSFTMTEGAMTGTGAQTSAPVTFSNIVVNKGDNCFDNNVLASGTVTGAAGAARTFNVVLTESGNSAVYSLTVGTDNNSVNGSYALTGGGILPGGTMACPASDAGTAVFSRQ